MTSRWDMSRRELLGAGLALAGARALPACGGGRASFDVPLPISPVLEPVRSTDDADVYEMTMMPGSVPILRGPETEIWGFNGLWPGPTIRARSGRAVIVRQTNGLPEQMSVHLHGANNPPDSDGHPNDFFLPGATREYVYPNQMAAAPLWYHDHVIDRTGYHLVRGLAGFYIIGDELEDSLDLPTGDYDIPIMLQDRRLDYDNQLHYRLDERVRLVGYRGDLLCVNGAVFPYLEVANVRYRFRLLNASNGRQYVLALDSGEPLLVIGSDGGLLPAPVPVRGLEIFPANRFDVIVDFSKVPVGSSVTLKNIFNPDVDPIFEDIMRFDVVRSESDQFDVPAVLRPIERLDPAAAAQVRSFDVRADEATTWTINGLSFDGARIDARPVLGTTEIWEWDKPGATGFHPMHLHLVQFQVLDVNGSPPPRHMQGWVDTVPTVQGKTRIIARFADHLGLYVFHCHIIEHEDHHMMGQFEVVPE
ncbi:MAG TPA: multicopper oxidase domain-containing protein [Kofleriaceae bacterium]|nr:multicopper oxidase domain-containing protein [Kofleriaceae bacterium]